MGDTEQPVGVPVLVAVTVVIAVPFVKLNGDPEYEILIGVFTTEREIVSLTDPAKLRAVIVNNPVESDATDGVPVIPHFPEE